MNEYRIAISRGKQRRQRGLIHRKNDSGRIQWADANFEWRDERRRADRRVAPYRVWVDELLERTMNRTANVKRFPGGAKLLDDPVAIMRRCHAASSLVIKLRQVGLLHAAVMRALDEYDQDTDQPYSDFTMLVAKIKALA